MESIQFVVEPLIHTLYGTGPAEPEWCGYIGNVIQRQHAAEIVQAVNTYDERQALLERVQNALFNLGSEDAVLAVRLAGLQAKVNAAVLQHHEWLEQQS